MTFYTMRQLKFLLLLFFIPFFTFSQNALVLNSKSRADIVTTISELLLNNYVFADTALKMSNCIKKKLAQGAYDKITEPVAFSDALTIDLYSVYRDGHLLVSYVPQQNTPPQAVQAVPVTNDDPMQSMKDANFGLKKTEVLPGNIGYLAIDRFWMDTIYGKETLKSALQFVANTRALIIDVRNCGGGSQDAVNLLCGYFLEKATHINDMYDRAAKTTTEYWTRPDKSFTKMTNKPLYILINSKTFSAAEEFCYDMQCIKRASIVGEISGGGAHGTFSRDAGFGFVLALPYSTAINPITKTSWEKVGVKPDIETSSAKALEKAEMLILDSLMSSTTAPSELFLLKWNLDLLKAINNPITLDIVTLKSYAGTYGERVFTFENGKLYYQRSGRPKFELEAMAPNIMKGLGNTYFKIEFVKNNAGVVDRVNAYYQNNTIETSLRSQ